MLGLKNRKREWVLSVLFGIASVTFMLVTFAYINSQGNKVVRENTDRDSSDGGQVKAAKRREQQKAAGGLEDTEKVYSDIANLRARLKDQNEDIPPSESDPSSTENQELAGVYRKPQKPLAPSGGSMPSSTSPEPDRLIGDDDPLQSPDLPPTEAPSEKTLLSYTGDTASEIDEDINLRAELSEADATGRDLSGNGIIFTLTDGTRTQLATATTDSMGIAQVLTHISLPTGFYDVNATFAGNHQYLRSSTEVPFVVWEAIAGLKIKGRGQLAKGSEEADFSFSAKYTKKSDVPTGQLQFVDRSGELELSINAEGFNWLIVTLDNLALLQGSASLNGQSGFLFEMLIADKATPGKGKDFFEFSIYGIPVASGIINSGNIVIH